MPLLLLLVLLLSGCSGSAESKLIDSYLADSAAGKQSHALTGRALIAQQRALALVSALGWSQSGSAKYSDLEVIEGGVVRFCLDVSEVGFMDAAGNQVELSRPVEKLLMSSKFVSVGQELRIENLEEVGRC
ncbi:MAG: hypothetical protein RIS08_1007 [Actinomycetota bacterium]|jgi:hypothetical protein